MRIVAVLLIVVSVVLVMSCFDDRWIPIDGSLLPPITGLVTTVTVLVTLFTFVARSRRARFKLVAVCSSLLTSWAASEAICWWLDPWRQNPFYDTLESDGKLADGSLRFKRPPGIQWEGLCVGDAGGKDPLAQYVEFRTDSEGFRNSVDLPSADIVFLGDSFTEAGNVSIEDIYVQKTAAFLDRTAINLAVAGFGPGEELTVLQRYGLKRKPQWVVWQLFEGNDLADAMAHLLWTQGGSPTKKDQGWLSSLKRWQRTSPLMQGWSTIQSCLKESPRPDYTFQRGDESIPIRFVYNIDQQMDPNYLPRRWKQVAKSLLSGQNLCQDNDIRLLVIFIPIKLRVMGIATELVNLPNGEFITEPSRFGSALSGFCKENDIYFMDPTEVLQRNAANGEFVYFPFDSHLTPQGHLRVAEQISDKIKKVEDTISSQT